MASNIKYFATKRARAIGTLFVTASITTPAPVLADTLQVEDYLSLSLESLLETTVSSVSKKEEDIRKAAASVHVISSEQIRRSPYQNIPDLLTMVPGIQSARVDANTWVISSRGFSDVASNKLLVLQDGRTLYNPVYGGVYWDTQSLPLEEVERIEIIRGPGAVFWGANAVNGIINIITKRATETQGGQASLTAAKQAHNDGYARYGFSNNDSAFRVYAHATRHDSNNVAYSNEDAEDDGRTQQAGFRLDSRVLDGYDWTLQGDIYSAMQNQISIGLVSPLSPAQLAQDDRIKSTGWNLLSVWKRDYDTPYGAANSTFQAYFDQNKRDELVLGLEYSTLDLEFTQRHYLNDKHELTWGLGYRHIWDEFDNTFRVSLLPDTDNRFIASGFIQDKITLDDNLYLSIGTKLEHHKDYQAELQPSVRMHWSATTTDSLWASVSRAVHMPSRFERDGNILTALIPFVPPPPAPQVPVFIPLTLGGDPSVQPEEVVSYELGYRTELSKRLSLDFALFYNDYKSLLSLEFDNFPNSTFDNKISGHSYGGEFSATWLPAEWWRLALGYSYLSIDMQQDADSTDPFTPPTLEGNAPHSQFMVSSWMDLRNNWSLDLFLRHNSPLKRTQQYTAATQVKDYTLLDARLAWQATRDINLSFGVRNLFDSETLEYLGPGYVEDTEIKRSLYCKLDIAF